MSLFNTGSLHFEIHEIHEIDDTNLSTEAIRIRTRILLSDYCSKNNIKFSSDELLNLNHLPHLNNYSISLSHTATGHGFAIIKNPNQIGFDIERPDRAPFNSVARVSKKEFLEKAPTPTHYWCAKEAAFKALSKSHNMKLLSDLEVKWIRCDSSTESTFTAVRNEQCLGEGKVFLKSNHLVAIFIL